MMNIYQRTGSNGSLLGGGGKRVGTAPPGMLQPRGSSDAAFIQVGEDHCDTLDVAARSLVWAKRAPAAAVTGSGRQVTATAGVGYGFMPETGAELRAGTPGVGSEGTATASENDAQLHDAAGETDATTIGADSGSASLLGTPGGTFGCGPTTPRGTSDLGGVRSPALQPATLAAAGDRRLATHAALAGAALALGLFAAGQPARLHLSNPGPLPDAAPVVMQDADVTALRDRAEAARAQLLARPGVAAVTLEGLRQQGVAIDYAPRRLAALGISPQALTAGLHLDASQSRPGHLQLAASEQEGLQSVADRQVQAGRQLVRLGDVALVSRVKLDPPVSTLQVKGVPAVWLRVTQVK